MNPINIPISQMASPEDLNKYKQFYNPNWGEQLLYRINLIWNGLNQISWGIVLIAFIVSYLTGYFVSWILFNILTYFKNRRGKYIDTSHTQSLIRSSRAAITITCFRFGLLEMLEDDIDRFFNDFLHSIALICSTYFGLSFWEVLIDSFIRIDSPLPRQLHTLILPFIRKMVRILIIVAGFASVAALNGVNINGFFALFAFGTVAFGLAAKETIENFFGAFSIVLDMPFGIGDWIKVGNLEGAVDQINIRSTRLRTASDSLLTIPNGNFVKACVENLGVRRHVHYIIEFSVSAEIDPKLLNEYCNKVQEAISQHHEVLSDKTYVYPINIDFKGVTIKTEVSYIALNYRKELEHKQNFINSIISLAQEMQIKLVFTSDHPVK